MDNIEKKERKKKSNRCHYLQRQGEFQERAKKKREQIKKALKQSQSKSFFLILLQWISRIYKGIQKKNLSLQRFFLLLLVGACTYYLLRETVTYLQEVEGNSSQAWLKALISEGLLIAFSGLSFHTFTLRFARIVILVGMCIYSLSAISCKVLCVSQKRLTSSTVNQKLIEDLEKDLSRKEIVYQHYLSQNRTGWVRKQEKQLDALRVELAVLRKDSTQMQTPQLISVTLITLLFFRLLVMVANIILIHQLSSSFRRTIHSSQGLRPPLVLVRG